MKRINLFLIWIVIIPVLLGSCGSTKSWRKSEKQTEIKMPFTGRAYKSDKNFFRAVQLGSSIDLSTAKKIAMQNAKVDLASGIQSTVKAVTEQYISQRDVNYKKEFENRFEEISRLVTNQVLSNVRVIDEKLFKAKNGEFTYHIAIEVKKDDVLTDIEKKVSNMQLEFDQAQFRKLFDEEMSKLEK